MNMINFWFLLCFGLVNCLEANQTDDQLVFAQIIFRHGDRTIRSTYPNDPYKDESHWPEGFAQLTNSGKIRQYELGKFFRRRYEQLLGDGAYSPNKVYATSTKYDRAMNSASLVLAGLFPPTGHDAWNKNLLWQPIPVHVPERNGYLLVVERVCARFDEALIEHANSDEVKALIEEHWQLFEYLEDHAGTPIRTLEHLKNLHNVLEVEQETNKTLPEWTRKMSIPKGSMEYLAQYWLKMNSDTTELEKLKSGFLLKDILDRFKSKSLSTLIPNYSIWIYSGHDLAIAAILNSFDLFELHIPPYSSSLLFELYKSSEGYYIQLFYRKTDTDDLQPMNIPQCGTKCTLEQLYDLFSDILPSVPVTDDLLRKECESKKSAAKEL